MFSNKNIFNEYLINHIIKKDDEKNLTITNTRIGDKLKASDKPKIFGGSYHISDDEYQDFLNLYYQCIIKKNLDEYLTEKQIVYNEKLDIKGDDEEIVNGPILIDLDFRYDTNTTEKQYTKGHIFDIVCLYLEELRNFVIFDENTSFSIYIMEKPNINILNDVVKDGIHIIIGLQMNHILQELLRKNVLTKINDEIDNIPLVNDWENVIDIGITKGQVNWQLYGSKKPDNQKYSLTMYYDITYDISDSMFMIQEKKTSDFDFENNLIKLSVRNRNNPKLPLNIQIEEEFNKHKNVNQKKKSNGNKNKKIKLIFNVNDENYENDDELNFLQNDNEIKLENINSFEILKKAVELTFSNLSFNEYYLKELHEYTQILPDKYYKPGSHVLNRQVAFALKNTDDRLFLSWVMLRSKAEDFDYSEIPKLYKDWNTHFNKKNCENKLTKKSIIYWAKTDAFEDFERVKKETIDYYIEITLNTPTDFDLATVLYQMNKDKYVCSSIVSSLWYVFKNHKWEIDKGNTLRLSISQQMYALYNNKINICVQERANCDDEVQVELLKKRYIRLCEISSKLKKTSDKNNIIREATELFYDGLFLKKLDANENLLCFNNGVIDFSTKTFRNGEPNDYISMSTNVDYISDYNTSLYKDISNDIHNFMKQLFPIPSLNEYMWQHLASCLVGSNLNQTFNIYKGVGSNGKSMLTDLMTQTLGDYKGLVPLTLITEKRGSIGGTSSEIMQLKGIRYAVMQEPSKDMKINEGVMKEITSGDPLQGRSLYHESEVFNPQFTLAVCTNVDFTILSNDDGTWRRIRRVPFLSKFVDNIDDYDLNDEDNKYIFPRDRGLKEKFPKWKNIFATLLVNKAFETNGIVNDCDIVLEESKNYRKCQDHITAFIEQYIIVTKNKNDIIKIRELTQQLKIWYDEIGESFYPKSKEIIEVMNRKIGKNKNNSWSGCLIDYKKNNNDDYDNLDEYLKEIGNFKL